jgi:hypothetical protein
MFSEHVGIIGKEYRSAGYLMNSMIEKQEYS